MERDLWHADARVVSERIFGTPTVMAEARGDSIHVYPVAVLQVGNGTFIVPTFTIQAIAQTSPFVSAANSIIVTIQTNVPLESSQGAVVISNLQGAIFGNSTVLITGTKAEIFCDQTGTPRHATWDT
eukprot:1768361-Rhodomonas_salina.1